MDDMTLADIELAWMEHALPLPNLGSRRLADAPPNYPSAATVEEIMNRTSQGMHGGIVVTTINGETTNCQSMGFADAENNEPMTCQHLMQIASCTKSFTGLLALIAARKGALDLDEPVQYNMPEFQPKVNSGAHDLTVRDVLNHRTGMQRHDKLWQLPFSPREGITRSELLKTVQFLEHSDPQRTKPTYNNIMYMVGGEATKHALNAFYGTQYEWADYIESEILTPLDMQDTFSLYGRYKDSRSAQPLAVGYNEDCQKDPPKQLCNKPMENVDGDAVAPSISVVTNGDDMGKYLKNFVDEFTAPNLLDTEGVTTLRTVQSLFGFRSLFGPGGGYSFGWEVTEVQGVNVYQHGGAAYGFSTNIVMIPSLKWAAFVGVNEYKSWKGEDVVSALVQQLLTGDHRRWLQTLLDSHRLFSPPEELVSAEINDARLRSMGHGRQLSRALQDSDFAGTYRHPAYGVYVIRAKAGGGLEYRMPMHQWFMKNPNVYLSMLKKGDLLYDPEGRPNTLRQYGIDMYFMQDSDGSIMAFLSKLESKGGVAPIAFTKREHPKYGAKWIDQEFRSLPLQFFLDVEGA